MEPTNNGGNWQDVPNSGPAQTPTPPSPGAAYPPPAQAYPPPAQAYPPPAQAHASPAQGGYPPQNYPPPPQAGYPPQQPPPGYAPPPSATSGMSPTAAAAVSYLTFIPAVIFLLSEPYKRIPLVRFHSMQCIALTVLSIVVSILLGVLGVVLAFAGMYTMIHLLSMLVNLAFFIAWVACIIQASQGKWFKLPVIGDFAMKQAQK